MRLTESNVIGKAVRQDEGLRRRADEDEKLGRHFKYFEGSSDNRKIE